MVCFIIASPVNVRMLLKSQFLLIRDKKIKGMVQTNCKAEKIQLLIRITFSFVFLNPQRNTINKD